MSIIYDGGLGVGAFGNDLKHIEDLTEWAEDNNLDIFSPYYDAEPEVCFYCFEIANMLVNELDVVWLDKIYTLGHQFEELTGVKPMLVGMQNIW